MSLSFRRAMPEMGGSLFQAVLRFYREDDWHFERVEGREAITMGFSGESGIWRCLALTDQEREQFAFFSSLDMKVPPEKRRLAAEYLTRANYGLPVGNFEMDFDDGEVRCKTSVDVEGGKLTSTMIRNLTYCNCALMDRYLPGLMKVVYGNTTPEAAIREIEQPVT